MVTKLNKIPPFVGPVAIPGRRPFTTYLDELRAEYGGTVYEIDPYVEVFQIRDNVWAMNAPCTHMVGDNWIYLIEGPEKALLIDNGYGIGDLKGLCELLVKGKPVLTALTHWHGDHSGGSYQWEEVYAHEYCADLMETRFDNYEETWKRFNLGNGSRPYWKEEDVIPFRPVKFVRMRNHDLIHLGADYDVEIIHMGGHSPDEVCFLDRRGRILYTGDAAFESRFDTLGIGLHGGGENDGMLHAECLDIGFYAEQIRALALRVAEWDSCAAGHGYFDSPATIITDLRDAIEAVLADPYSYTKTVERKGRTEYMMQRGLANCRFGSPEVIAKKYGSGQK